jgi:DNA adenine methylase
MKSNPLKWHGGKSYLAKRICELMPPHTRYAEPFFGGGAFLFSRDGEGVSEFANDINSSLMTFWRVLADSELSKEFVRRAAMMPHSQAMWHEAHESYRGDFSRPVDAALAFFITYRQSRQGLGKDYCTPTSRLRRKMNENVSAGLSAVDGLNEAHERIRRVEVRCQDACDFIEELDSADTLFYCDPPYLHETRQATTAYEHEMTADDHSCLLAYLGKIKGKFLLSGYPIDLYSAAADQYGWSHHDFTIDNKARSATTKAQKIERVWMNNTRTAKKKIRLKLPAGLQHQLSN